MFAKNLRDDLMNNDQWIENHVGDCVTDFLLEPTLRSRIIPIVNEVADSRQREDDLEEGIAVIATESLTSGDDLSKTVNCINMKVVHEARTRSMPKFAAEYLYLSCALFGRYFRIRFVELGYIKG